jgi:vancomycin resistance protein YoaR
MKKTVTILGAILGGVLAMGVILVTAFELTYQQRAYPGVTVAGQSLEGRQKSQIIDWLARKVDNLSELTLRWGVNEWKVPVSDLGVSYDPLATGKQVLDVGRKGDWKTKIKTKIGAAIYGLEVEPVVTYDLAQIDQAMASISGQINIPAKEPEIIKSGNPLQIMVSAGENGQEVNTAALKQKIIRAIIGLDTEKIDIPVTAVKPQLSEEQVERAKTKAENLIGKKLTINFSDEKQKWELADEALLTWLDLPSGNWSQPVVKKWIEDLAGTVDRPAQDASFRWVGQDKVEEFKPARDGVKVNIPVTTTMVLGALDNLEQTGTDQTAELIIDKIQPEITNGQVNDLGIKELLGKGESWFTGSITNRIFNLKKAAEVINGKLVAPGETFSFNDTIGEVSADTGYKQAYIIKEGKTILGDGGGVCQVSTTLFRAVLATGLPIVARTAHAYRVSYYEVNYQVGFDATVFQPAPDFRFVNDTPGYILIQMVYDEPKKYLSFEIYGTSDERKVELSKSRIWDVVPPPPDLYIDDPNLPVGKVTQTEHAARGSKVAFDWKVTRGGEVLQQRTFYSNYRPWQAVYLRGTKTN